MAMMNISLPEKQIEEVDLMVEKYGYANRSEFIRSALRFVLRSKQSAKQAADFPFIVASTNSDPVNIIEDFKASGKYSKEFLADLAEGLKKSKAFGKNV